VSDSDVKGDAMINSIPREPVQRGVLPDPDEVTQLLEDGLRSRRSSIPMSGSRSWRTTGSGSGPGSRSGSCTKLREAGDYLTTRAGSVPVVAVRGADGELRAFVNICQHRMHIVARGQSGRRKTLQCIYHGWTYGLDGCLRAIPRADEGEIEFEEFGLVPAAVDTFKGVVWVSVEPPSRFRAFWARRPRSPSGCKVQAYGPPIHLSRENESSHEYCR
jgi:nitrite reductase/ring-hydroxylating ferredoxin subunit